MDIQQLHEFPATAATDQFSIMCGAYSFLAEREKTTITKSNQIINNSLWKECTTEFYYIRTSAHDQKSACVFVAVHFATIVNAAEEEV